MLKLGVYGLISHEDTGNRSNWNFLAYCFFSALHLSSIFCFNFFWQDIYFRWNLMNRNILECTQFFFPRKLKDYSQNRHERDVKFIFYNTKDTFWSTRCFFTINFTFKWNWFNLRNMSWIQYILFDFIEHLLAFWCSI